jgi:hypothetical protein
VERGVIGQKEEGAKSEIIYCTISTKVLRLERGGKEGNSYLPY